MYRYVIPQTTDTGCNNTLGNNHTNMNQLYPLKFKPIYKSRIWGGNRLRDKLNKTDAPAKCGESWEISSIDDNLSVVSEGFLSDNNIEELIEVYMGDLVGDRVFEQFGVNFPLLIKYIDANDDLSVQVHPNDEIAMLDHNSYGKTEMWYILETAPESTIVTGLKPGIKPDELLKKLKDNTLEDILLYETAEAGDVFYIPAGRVHATGKGVLLLEIQQTSDLTYRLYDYNRKDSNGEQRTLHIEPALKAIDYTLCNSAKIRQIPQINHKTNLVDSPYFTVNLIKLDKTIAIDYAPLDSFVIYSCTEGSCNIYCDDNKEAYNLTKGETTLIPAIIDNIRIAPVTAATSIIEIYINTSKADQIDDNHKSRV